MVITHYTILGTYTVGKFLSCVGGYINSPCALWILGKEHDVPMSEDQQRKWVLLVRVMGNEWSKMVCDFWLYHVT